MGESQHQAAQNARPCQRHHDAKERAEARHTQAPRRLDQAPVHRGECRGKRPQGVNDPRTLADVGNGFPMRRGYTVVWSGWDPDAPRANMGLALTAPVATDNGQPIVKTVRDEFCSGTRGGALEVFKLSYEAATLEQPRARLTVRERADDEPHELPLDQWSFVDARSIKLSDGAKPKPGHLYEFHYQAKNPKVLGLGFAATRDVISFLRYNKGAHAATGRPITHALDGYLRIATGNCMLRIHPTDVEQVASMPSFWPAYVLYDKSDGLAGQPRLLSDSTSIRTPGGALWFVTGEGITIVDPKALSHETGAPVVSIDKVVVDDAEIAATPDVEMPAGTRRLQFEYSALNLTAPQKTRYRFRLEGVDTEWIDAGTRRQTSYTNLAPGAYRFRVVATSALGEWLELPTAWTFSIKPHIYQTRWFSVLSAALLVLVAFAAWTLRLRQERKRFSLLLAERVRLSREIHDTLLQGLVGVALHCDALACDMQTAAPEMSERFVRLRKQTQRYIKESRQAIWNLRSSPLEHDLVAALRRVGDQSAGTGSEFALDISGQPRELSFDIEQQLVRIAHEAVANAVRHAGARRIEVGLDYQADRLVLQVSDDGSGFVENGRAGTDGHYGIVSMRERADGIKASFALDSAIGRGTRIAVVLPAANESKSAR